MMISEKQNSDADNTQAEEKKILKMLKESIEENQTRRILEILDNCYAIPEAKEKIKRLLKPTPEYRQAAKAVLEKDDSKESRDSRTNDKKDEKGKDEGTKFKTIRMNDACERYGLKRATMTKLAKDADSVVRIGRTVLINVTKLDAYLDAMSGE